MSSFFLDAENPSADYRALRDSPLPPVRAARSAFDTFWSLSEPYVESDIRLRAVERLHPCFWEIYLAAALLKQGLPLTPRKERTHQRKGPDLHIKKPSCWVEATATGSGRGPDSVPEPPDGHFEPLPQDRIKLRITSALDEKNRKYNTYVSEELMASTDPFVVAINVADVPSAHISSESIWMVGSVYPIGPESITFDSRTRKQIRHFHQYQGSICKMSGNPVPATAFASAEYSGISAVLYSSANAFNPGSHPGFDFVVVHNSRATNPLARGTLPSWREYWVEEDRLYWQQRYSSDGTV